MRVYMLKLLDMASLEMGRVTSRPGAICVSLLSKLLGGYTHSWISMADEWDTCSHLEPIL